MKDLRMKAYHRKYRKMFDVVGIMAIGNSDAKVYVTDTVYPLSEVTIIHCIGESDSKNEKIYESYILEFVLRQEGCESMLIKGRVVFHKGCFRLMYDKVVNEDKIEIVELMDPKWKEMRIVSNLYEPNLDLKGKT